MKSRVVLVISGVILLMLLSGCGEQEVGPPVFPTHTINPSETPTVMAPATLKR